MTDRLTTLRAMLARREGHNEYRDSLPLVRAEIARLEAMNELARLGQEFDASEPERPEPKEWR